VDGLVNSGDAPRVLYQPVNVKLGVLINTLPLQRQFAYSVLRQQPLRVAGDIARDSVKVFALTRNAATGDTAISRWQFQASYPYYPPASPQTAGQCQPGLRRHRGRRVRPGQLHGRHALRDYQLHGGYTPGPVLLIALLAGIAGIFTFPGAGPGAGTGTTPRAWRWPAC